MPQSLTIRFLVNYRRCNYTCEYCIVQQRSPTQSIFKKLWKYRNPKNLFHRLRTTRPVWDEAQYFRIVRALKEIPHQFSIRIGMNGELFLNKDLVDGARQLSQASNCTTVNLITNLSFLYKDYLKCFEGFAMDKVAMVASYHDTQVNNKEVWLDRAQKMNDIVDFAIVVVAWPPLIKKLPEIKTMFTDKGLTVFFGAFHGYYKGKKYPESYTQTEREILRNIFYSRHDYEYMVNLKKPGLCFAGVDYIYLDMNGDIFRCGSVYSPLGNIISKNYKLLERATACPAHNCSCDTDNMNTKEFRENYKLMGINQHKYIYRYKELAGKNPTKSEWKIPY